MINTIPPNIHIQPVFHPSIPYPCMFHLSTPYPRKGPTPENRTLSDSFLLIAASLYHFFIVVSLFLCMSIGAGIMAMRSVIACM